VRPSRALVLALLLVTALVVKPATAASGDTAGVSGWLKSNPANNGGKSKSKNVAPAKPSMMTNITNAPKRFVSSTKNLLTPKKAPPAPAKHSTTSSRTISKSNPPQSPGFFKSLFGSEPPPPPKSVGEWMKLEQVKP
jgi:hypothetical protein